MDNTNNSKYKVYFVTAPFEKADSGDSDYVDGIMALFPGSMSIYCKPQWNEIELKGMHNKGDFKSGFMTLLMQNGGIYKKESERSKRFESYEEFKEVHINENAVQYYSFYNKAYYDNAKVFRYEEQNVGKITINQKRQIRFVRQAIARNLMEQITDDEISPEITKILNLQLRPIDNGTIFAVEELQELKKKGIKIVITCHEFTLNCERPEKHFNYISMERFKVADHIIFFNGQDLENADDLCQTMLNFSIKAKSSLSQVITPMSVGKYGNVTYNLSPILDTKKLPELVKRSANIMMFGLIRNGKGFNKYTIPIARQLRHVNKEKNTNYKLIVVGGITIYPLAQEMVNGVMEETSNIDQDIKYLIEEFLDCLKRDRNERKIRGFCERLNDLLDKNDKTHKNKLLPIRFNFFATPEETEKLFNECKYAFVCDEIKGFANNASAMITALAQGTILYANLGHCTSDKIPQNAIQWVDIRKDPTVVAEDIVNRIKFLEDYPSKQTEIFETMSKYFFNTFSIDTVKKTLVEVFDRMVNKPKLDFERTIQDLKNENQQNQTFIHHLQQTNNQIKQNKQVKQLDGYTEQQLNQLLRYYYHEQRNNNAIVIAKSNIYFISNNGFEEILKEQLSQIRSGKSKIGVIVLDVNPVNDNFSSDISHWVALVVEVNNSQTEITLIDPMGRNVIRQGVLQSVSTSMSLGVKFIGVFDEENHPQHNGNPHDCGPFLVEAFERLVGGQPVDCIQEDMKKDTLEESQNYGQEIRKNHQQVLLKLKNEGQNNENKYSSKDDDGSGNDDDKKYEKPLNKIQSEPKINQEPESKKSSTSNNQQNSVPNKSEALTLEKILANSKNLTEALQEANQAHLLDEIHRREILEGQFENLADIANEKLQKISRQDQEQVDKLALEVMRRLLNQSYLSFNARLISKAYDIAKNVWNQQQKAIQDQQIVEQDIENENSERFVNKFM